jgi:hypothetical protein
MAPSGPAQSTGDFSLQSERCEHLATPCADADLIAQRLTILQQYFEYFIYLVKL